MTIVQKERIFKALGDRNRLEIMDLLKDKELSAGQILEEIKMGQSTLSHHMKILCDSGIVASRKESRWVYYAIDSAVAHEVSEILVNWVN